MKKLYFVLFAVVLLAAGFWLYTGPQRALRDIKVAAEAGDVEGIRERVDVPAVKESLKEQFMAMMQKKLDADPQVKDNPFAGLGALFANTMVDKLVDAAITPTHLVAILKGDRATAFGQGSDAPARAEAAAPPELQGSYNSLDRYTLRVLNKATHQQAIALTMHRDGLSWRLTAIQLPMEAVAKE